MKRIHLIISGSVQNVFFRDNTKKKAESLGIVGWVKNLETGKVETVAQGEEEKIEKFLEWCKRGPLIAHVDNIEKKELKPTEDFKSFEIIY